MKKIIVGVLALAAFLPGAAGAVVELGTNDRRISFMGPFNDPEFEATQPVLTYNPNRDDFLLVWKADDNAPGPTPPLQVNDEDEIFGVLLDAEAKPSGNEFVVSKSGPPGDPNFDAELPRAAYNATDDQYLVVWEGEDIVDDDVEIFGRLMNGDGTGASIFSPVSSMGAPGDTDSSALFPVAAYNSVDNEYLVAWLGDDDAAPSNTSAFALYVQRIDKDGLETGVDDRLISASPIAGALGGPFPLSLVHNPVRNEYVLLYMGFDLTHGSEIYGQRLAADGSASGAAFKLSTMGPDGVFSYTTQFGALVFNPERGEYLAVWSGSDDREPLAPSELEIYGQRFDEDGNEIGTDDFRISDGGFDGNQAYSANPFCTVAYNPTDREYLVVWPGRGLSPFLDSQEVEVFGQLLDEEGAEIGDNDFRLSDMGPFGDASFGYGIQTVSAAHNAATNEYVVAWSSDDTGTGIQPQVQGEYEVFVQRFASHVCGNAEVELHEDCDDGNSDDGDGCSAACAIEDDGGTTGDGTTAGGTTTGGDTTGGDTSGDSESAGGCSLVR